MRTFTVTVVVDRHTRGNVTTEVRAESFAEAESRVLASIENHDLPDVDFLPVEDNTFVSTIAASAPVAPATVLTPIRADVRTDGYNPLYATQRQSPE